MGEILSRLMPLACAGLVAAAALTGCAGDAPTTAEAEVAPTGATGALDLEGSVDLEGTDGSTYVLRYVVAASPWTATAATAGKSKVASTVERHQLTLTNSGDAPAPGLPLKVVSIYEESSMACQLDGMPGPLRVDNGPHLAEITSGPKAGTRVCYVDRTRQLMVDKGAALAPGASADLVPRTAAWTPTDPSTSTEAIHESAMHASLAALNSPVASVIVTSPIGGSNTCGLQDDFEAGVTAAYSFFDPSGTICG